MNRTLLGALAGTVALIPSIAGAHNPWLKPSTTIVSGQDGWVTIDAAASTDVFVADHQPLPLEMVKVTAPDGSAGTIENGNRGRLRTTFDVHLTQQGTYRIGTQMAGAFGSYKIDGKDQRLPRGTAPDQIKGLIPANATDVKITENSNRNEVFVTLGAPNDAALKPTGKGLELVPVTHPDDLVAGEPAMFGFQIDGKPAPGLKVTLIADGKRYRDSQQERTFTTDAKGQVKLTWPTAGLYWLSAGATDTKTTVPGATERRLGYAATFEVLQP